MTRFQRGFTLVETVVAIVITGIVAAMVSMFIRTPIQQYMDAEARAAITDAADTALRRIGRDLRLALPNSVRVDPTRKYIEFLQTSGGGRYLAEEDSAAGNILDFMDASKLTFDVLGPIPTISAGDSIVVYNLGPGISPADAYCASAAGCNNRAVVDSVAAKTVTLLFNSFGAQAPAEKMRSPNRRFQVVTGPVSYGCAGGTLTRYSGYAIAVAQSTTPGGTAAVLATGVTDCSFSYAPLNQRSALVGLWIKLQNSAGDEWITLFHQIHVDNSP